MEGGPDPCDGVSAYWHPDGYWHYVTFGMAEQGIKYTDNPGVSGWGFEFSFRLAAPQHVRDLGNTPSENDPFRPMAADHAPMWVLNFLNDLGRYVFDSRRGFAHGHYVAQPGRRIPYVGLVTDPTLGSVQTVNGTFTYLQAVALTAEQFERFKGDGYAAFVEELQRDNPMLVSDVDVPTQRDKRER